MELLRDEPLEGTLRQQRLHQRQHAHFLAHHVAWLELPYFDMLYMPEHGIGTRTAPEEKLKIRGDWLLWNMSGRNALMTRTWPKRFTSRSFWPSSMFTPSIGPVAMSAIPALLMSRSRAV